MDPELLLPFTFPPTLPYILRQQDTIVTNTANIPCEAHTKSPAPFFRKPFTHHGFIQEMIFGGQDTSNFRLSNGLKDFISKQTVFLAVRAV